LAEEVLLANRNSIDLRYPLIPWIMIGRRKVARGASTTRKNCALGGSKVSGATPLSVRVVIFRTNPVVKSQFIGSTLGYPLGKRAQIQASHESGVGRNHPGRAPWRARQ
jgi:hypothetical protein